MLILVCCFAGSAAAASMAFVVDSMRFIVTCLFLRSTNQPYNCLCDEALTCLSCNAVGMRDFPHGSEVADFPRRLFRDKKKEKDYNLQSEMTRRRFYGNVIHFRSNNSLVSG